MYSIICCGGEAASTVVVAQCSCSWLQHALSLALGGGGGGGGGGSAAASPAISTLHGLLEDLDQRLGRECLLAQLCV